MPDDLYQDIDETTGEPAETEQEETSETIAIPSEELSGQVAPGTTLKVVSVEDGIVTLAVVESEDSEA